MTQARGIIGAIIIVLGLPGVAAAHPEVERLRHAVMQGDYEAARPGLDALLERDDLLLRDLVAALELRAVLFHGMPDEAALEATLRALIEIDPEHRFGARYPPDLAQRSEAIRAQGGPPLGVITRVVPSAVGVRLEAEVENDPEDLVRRLRFRVFEVDSGQWTSAEPPLEAESGREWLVLVEAIGPGGAVVATAGTSDEPIRVSGPGVAIAEVEVGRTRDAATTSESDGWVTWAIFAAVVAVLAGGAIGVGIYLADSPIITWQPSRPMETR